MEHQWMAQLGDIADVSRVGTELLTPKERLERWAALLDRQPDRRLSTLGEIELAPRSERPHMRVDNSPLTVAFEDPVLRANGLKSDNLGDALSFFEITEGDAHYILCSCMNGSTMTGKQAAKRVRSISGRTVERLVLLSCVGGALAVPALIMLLG
jgi:hypothetical protein